MAFRFDTVRVWRAGGRYDHFVLRYALPIEAFRSAASSLDDGAAACGHAHPIDPVRETKSGLATLVAARNDILTSACVHYVDRSLEASEKARGSESSAAAFAVKSTCPRASRANAAGRVCRIKKG